MINDDYSSDLLITTELGRLWDNMALVEKQNKITVRLSPESYRHLIEKGTYQILDSFRKTGERLHVGDVVVVRIDDYNHILPLFAVVVDVKSDEVNPIPSNQATIETITFHRAKHLMREKIQDEIDNSVIGERFRCPFCGWETKRKDWYCGEDYQKWCRKHLEKHKMEMLDGKKPDWRDEI